MRVALTGVSGFIGAAIARHLKEQNYAVIGLVRSTSRRDHIEPYVERFVVGDQSDETCWDDLLNGADVLIHNSINWPKQAEYTNEQHWQDNLVGGLKLIERAMPRQVIFMSTIAVHHDMRPRWNGVIDEDHPTRPAHMYGAYKAAIEAHLWAWHFAEGLNFAAIRPCAVYGIDPNLQRSHGHTLIEKLRRGEAIDKPGGGKFVHVDDVAAATVACIGNPDANGKVYNLVDCYARWADWAIMAAELLGVDAEVDTSSPPQPKNVFTKDAVQSLGVAVDRGHDGIRTHLRELIEVMGGTIGSAGATSTSRAE
jgi:nucleoside-diphosphate-sugar epimerase